MMRLRKTLFAVALAALCAALTGVASAAASQQPAPGSVTISNPGGRDFSGFLIVVEPSGRAFALDGAGHSTGQLQGALTQTLFADLAAAGPLASLPERNCDEAMLIGWNGQRSSNLGCSADPRAVRLLNDITAIQRSLYVQSYRIASTQGTPSGGYSATQLTTSAATSPVYGGTRSASTSVAAGYNAAGYNSATCSCAFGAVNSTFGYLSNGGPNFNGASAGLYGQGSFASNFSNGFNSNRFTSGGQFQNTQVQSGRFSETGRFSRSSPLSDNTRMSSSVPRGSFSNSNTFGSDQSFANNGSTFGSAPSGGLPGSTTPH
jgi:hypothetical protein